MCTHRAAQRHDFPKRCSPSRPLYGATQQRILVNEMAEDFQLNEHRKCSQGEASHHEQ